MVGVDNSHYHRRCQANILETDAEHRMTEES